MENPKAKLIQLSMKLKSPAPTFVISEEKSDGNWVCTCTISALETATGSIGHSEFVGEAASKKLAATKAAEKAWTAVKDSGVAEVLQPPEDLVTVVASALASKVLNRDADLEGHVWLAQDYKQGHIPATILCNARGVVQYFNARQPSQAGDLQAMAYQLRSTLLDKLHCVEGSEVHVASKGPPTVLMLKDPYTGDPNNSIPHDALRASIELGKSRVYAAVLIPADSRGSMREVKVEGGGYYWDTLIRALGGDPEKSEMLCWGKVGHVLRRIVPHDQENSDPDNDTELHALLQKHLGDMGKRRRKSAQEATAGMLRDQIAQAREQGVPVGSGLLAAAEAADIDKLPVMEVRNPTLYSLLPPQEGEGQLNVRASFLAGRPVLGDALLSKIRLRPNEWGHPSQRWGGFELGLCEEWLVSLTPSARYAVDKHMPLLSRLPEQCRSTSGWFGASPEELLRKTCNPGLVGKSACPIYMSQDAGEDEAFRITATINVLGSTEPLSATSAPASDEAVARQDSALALLRKLDAHIRTTMFPPGSLHRRVCVPAPPPCLPLLPTKPPTEDGQRFCIEVVHSGEMAKATPKAPGSLVTVSYKLSAPSLSDGVLEKSQKSSFQFGCGGVAPELDAIVAQLGLYGKAICKGLWAPGPWADVNLEVELLGWKQPPPQTPSQKLFEIPVAQQRYAFALDLIKQQSARSVLDIGCGEGRLLEHLLTQKAPVDNVTGMDCSVEAVRKAEKRISSVLAESSAGDACLGMSTSAGSLPKAQILHENITEKATDPGSWGSLHGVDMALMIEVVEHLDADVLESVGPALLGNLAPNTLIMSTPNREYNAVLQHLGCGLLANGLRNSDHRFEWTREEFRSWSNDLADKYAYTVEFEVLGRAIQEARALGSSAANVGCATQVAIFKKFKKLQ